MFRRQHLFQENIGALPSSAPLHFYQGYIYDLLGFTFLQFLGYFLPLAL